MSAPYYYDYINKQNSTVKPSTVHIHNTGLSMFFKRYLLQRAISVFKWKLPETWSKDYFLYSLYCWGYVAIVNTDKFGVIPQACGLSGYDVFYQPTNAIIANPLLRGTLQPKIGKECTLIKLQPDYGNVMGLVDYYGDLLALTAESTSVNLVNTHMAYVFAAGNKASAETFKKLYDRVASGEVCAVVDKSLFNDDGSPTWQTFTQNVGQNYISDKLLSDFRRIQNMFDTEIGIPNTNTEKKERMLADEVTINAVETASKVDLWLEELKDSCERANKMFGLDMSVEWRYRPQNVEGGNENGNRQPAGTVQNRPESV